MPINKTVYEYASAYVYTFHELFLSQSAFMMGKFHIVLFYIQVLGWFESLVTVV